MSDWKERALRAEAQVAAVRALCDDTERATGHMWVDAVLPIAHVRAALDALALPADQAPPTGEE